MLRLSMQGYTQHSQLQKTYIRSMSVNYGHQLYMASKHILHLIVVTQSAAGLKYL
jgi:hypothetical protein